MDKKELLERCRSSRIKEVNEAYKNLRELEFTMEEYIEMSRDSESTIRRLAYEKCPDISKLGYSQEELRRLAKSHDAGYRSLAAGKCDSKDVVMKLLFDKEAVVAQQAFDSLSRFGLSPMEYERVLKKMAASPHAHVRCVIAEGCTGDKQILMKLLMDKDVANSAFRTLRQYFDATLSSQDYKQCAQSPSGEARKLAAEKCTDLYVLMKLLLDTYPSVADIAYEHLSKLLPPEEYSKLDKLTIKSGSKQLRMGAIPTCTDKNVLKRMCIFDDIDVVRIAYDRLSEIGLPGKEYRGLYADMAKYGNRDVQAFVTEKCADKKILCALCRKQDHWVAFKAFNILEAIGLDWNDYQNLCLFASLDVRIHLAKNCKHGEVLELLKDDRDQLVAAIANNRLGANASGKRNR